MCRRKRLAELPHQLAAARCRNVAPLAEGSLRLSSNMRHVSSASRVKAAQSGAVYWRCYRNGALGHGKAERLGKVFGM